MFLLLLVLWWADEPLRFSFGRSRKVVSQFIAAAILLVSVVGSPAPSSAAPLQSGGRPTASGGSDTRSDAGSSSRSHQPGTSGGSNSRSAAEPGSSNRSNWYRGNGQSKAKGRPQTVVREGTKIPPTEGMIVLSGRRWTFIPKADQNASNLDRLGTLSRSDSARSEWSPAPTRSQTEITNQPIRWADSRARVSANLPTTNSPAHQAGSQPLKTATNSAVAHRAGLFGPISFVETPHARNQSSHDPNVARRKPLVTRRPTSQRLEAQLVVAQHGSSRRGGYEQRDFSDAAGSSSRSANGSSTRQTDAGHGSGSRDDTYPPSSSSGNRSQTNSPGSNYRGVLGREGRVPAQGFERSGNGARLDGSDAKRWVLAENLMLQRIVKAIRVDPADNQWIVSGIATEFFGANRMVIRTAQRSNSE